MPLALFMEKLKEKTGADLVRVPFRGGGEAVNAVLGGSTPVAFFGLANWISYLQAGSGERPGGRRRRSARRCSPTFRRSPELGYRDNLTPRLFRHRRAGRHAAPIVHKLRDEIARIGADPAFRQKRLIESGLDPVFDTPEDFAKFLQHDRAISEQVVKASGLQPQ